MYVADGWKERIQILNPDLTLSRTFGKSGANEKGVFEYPQGVACDCTGPGRCMCLSDAQTCRVLVFTGFLGDLGEAMAVVCH